MKLTTVCYLRQGDEVLMLHRIKKEVDINKGKWVGVGGRFENGESPLECAMREVKEETGLTMLDPQLRAHITFNFLNPDPSLKDWETEYTFVYTCEHWEGELTESEIDEGLLYWIPLDALPGLDLWEGDSLFLDLIFHGAPFFAMKMTYDGDKLVNWTLD